MNVAKLTKNTAALFLRQIFVLCVNLYTLRILLRSLGIEDFALLNTITNIVMLGSFLPTAMTTIIQRYMSHAIGSKDVTRLKQVHDASFAICILSSLVIVLILETAGLWFVSYRLVVPLDKVGAAKILFHFMILSFTISNITGFFSSTVTAHEDMHIFAIFSLGDAVVRVLAATVISVAANYQLELYGLIQCVGLGCILIAYAIFCRRRYPKFSTKRSRLEASLLTHMLGFAGWTIFGQLTTIARNQAVSILINQSFSPATMAARALASSISAQVLTLSTNFSMPLHPPIIKAHAAEQQDQMFSLIFTGSKITFFLVWLGTLPILIGMPGILALWLGNYPVETVHFSRLALIENGIVAISFPLMTAVRATGNMQTYELVLGSMQLLILLLSWILVKAGHPAYQVYVVAIVINLAMFVARLTIASGQVGLPISLYISKVLQPVLLVTITSSALAILIMWLAPWVATLRPFPPALFILGVNALLMLGFIYFLGLSQTERQAAHNLASQRLRRAGARL